MKFAGGLGGDRVRLMEGRMGGSLRDRGKDLGGRQLDLACIVREDNKRLEKSWRSFTLSSKL